MKEKRFSQYYNSLKQVFSKHIRYSKQLKSDCRYTYAYSKILICNKSKFHIKQNSILITKLLFLLILINIKSILTQTNSESTLDTLNITKINDTNTTTTTTYMEDYLSSIIGTNTNITSSIKKSYLNKLIQYNSTQIKRNLNSSQDDDLIYIELHYNFVNKTNLNTTPVINQTTVDFNKSILNIKLYWFLPEAIWYMQNETYFIGVGFHNTTVYTYEEEISNTTDTYLVNTTTVQFNYDNKICKVNQVSSLKKCQDYYQQFNISTTQLQAYDNFTEVLKDNFSPELDYYLNGENSYLNYNMEYLISKYISPYKNLLQFEFNLPMFTIGEDSNHFTILSNHESGNYLSYSDYYSSLYDFTIFGDDISDYSDLNFSFLNNLTVFYGHVKADLVEYNGSGNKSNEYIIVEEVSESVNSTDDNTNNTKYYYYKPVIKFEISGISNMNISEVFSNSLRIGIGKILFVIILVLNMG